MSAASALYPPRANVSADLLTQLSDLLLRVDGRPVILLRPLASNFDFRRDDVDLLLTERQRTQLLTAAFEASARGEIHLRIRQASAEKIQLILWNLSCRSSLAVDLWSAFSQFPNHRGKLLRADHFRKFPAPSVSCAGSPSKSFALTLSSTSRLPADIDFCLFILHLASKKKRLSVPLVRERLFQAYERLRALSLDAAGPTLCGSDIAILLQAAEQLPGSSGISAQLVSDAEAYLLKRIRAANGDSRQRILESRDRRSLRTSFRRWLMKRVPCLAIVGSDGAGKSSVCQSFAGSQPASSEPVVARKLYRRSLLYQLVSGAAKRIIGLDRGVFDDHVAGWITLRASFSMWLRFAVRSMTVLAALPTESAAATAALSSRSGSDRHKTLLLDRSAASFLIRDRKSDLPRLHWSASLLEQWTPPVTTVLLNVPFEQLADRKQEMSFLGHQRYQRLLFQQALRQHPSDVIVVANTQSAGDAARAIHRICSSHYEPAVGGVAEEAAA